jgi:uncharacterized membrane protein
MKLLHIILIGITMLSLDLIYLSTFSGFFNKLVKSIQGTPIEFNIIGAILCYLLLIGGLSYFILSKKRALKDAFLLGLVIYGVYETTNYTILKNWSFKAVMLDTLWGAILFTLTSAIYYRFIAAL